MDLKANVEGKKQCSVLAKVRDGNQRDKSVGKSVYAKRFCSLPVPVPQKAFAGKKDR